MSNNMAKLLVCFVQMVLTFTAFTDSASAAVDQAVKGRDRPMNKDQFAYLEDNNSERTQEWVQRQNQRTLRELEGDSRFKTYHTRALEAEEVGTDKTGMQPRWGRMSLQGPWIYQIWNDLSHPRGVWRRASLKSFLAKAPVWETLLDIDALADSEKKNWTLIDLGRVSPNGRRALLQLSIGSSSTSEWREFDLVDRKFVADGFRLPPAFISRLVWRNDDVVLVSGNFGPGTVTKGGAPLVVKEWRRGEPLGDAKEIFRGNTDDIAVTVDDTDAMAGAAEDEGTAVLRIFQKDKTGRVHWWQLDTAGQLERMTLPSPYSPNLYRGHYVFYIPEDWSVGGKTWKAGSILSIPASEITQPVPRVYLVVPPTQDVSITGWHERTQAGLLLVGTVLGNGRIWRARFANDQWTVSPVPMPEHGSISYGATDTRCNDAFFVYQSFLQPRAVYRIDVEQNRVQLMSSMTAQFDSAPFMTEELEVKSVDGVLVPYVVVRAKTFRYDGSAPTLIHGYGGFAAAQSPAYSGVLGRLWLEKGGVYVTAKVRGGTERGKSWWVTGVKRRHTYDDMIAVAEDLIRRRITSAKRIGLKGHSAGGVLVGTMMTQRPDLFGGIIAEVPLLDQFRMDLMGMGAVESWTAEFGSPDKPEERAFLLQTSPFQNLRPGREAPVPFIITSATDQTVLPAQPRRFAAKMEALGMPFLFYETAEGGHGLVNTAAQRAHLEALEYLYLARRLIDPYVVRETRAAPSEQEQVQQHGLRHEQ